MTPPVYATGNTVWDLGLDEGTHPNGVVADDTLYATSNQPAAKEEHGFNRA